MCDNEVNAIVEQCPPEALEKAISLVFRRLLANILLDPDNPKFRVVRRENNFIRNVLVQIPDSVEDTLFNNIGYKLEKNSDSEPIYVFNGDREKLKTSDRFLSSIEEKIEEVKRRNIVFQTPPLETKVGEKTEERREAILQGLRKDAEERKKGFNDNRISSFKDLFNPNDFKSVEHLKENSRRTLLNTGRIRNSLFEGRHYTLRRMTHGRVYACKDGCAIDCLEAHWHLFSGKNLMYSFVAHLSPDASKVLHLGVEHGYQYNSLPGTENFGKTILFSSKRLNETDGSLEFLEHPNRSCETCVYCAVPFSELFL
ncbi:PUB domain [Trypanosoma melophagium]|uniref:PUB domain n=1 Tax=Trypanosoma melophagium TaxID=715481 RepID=UPI00351A230D|nr:PUB domain [Trypanosoma melophagium]